ncbi:ribonuclease P/MRP protein subunit POP7 [[Emmonsia] crescens]|uniref:Ribonuclease P/MRP protein subunit POP7 n=1 Tax=[Emmonsia] crescens TaxID=73230 RepID=A0A2B7Z7E8_9EURO|nr:ribonuclease P/MRP protein subunit POP7 [Emmonsia crescens]
MTKPNPHPELKFEKKNKRMPKVPSYARIQKRPIPHPPSASPYAGAKVPKVVYVSTNTPFMSAAKRVQKLLKQAERRATSRVDLSKKISEKQKLAKLTESTEELKKEEVFIKATGRAIEKAMSIGKWFEAKEEYAIRVNTGSVMVVDDIVEDERLKRKLETKEEEKEFVPDAPKETPCEVDGNAQPADTDKGNAGPLQKSKPATKKRKRRGNEAVDANGELLESRTRWVNMVEIAVTLK